MPDSDFEWDAAEGGCECREARSPFLDSPAGTRRVLAEDLAHNGKEKRYSCFGVVDGSVLTVRFTIRAGKYRIIGAGYWRKGRKIYEEGNQVHG